MTIAGLRGAFRDGAEPAAIFAEIARRAEETREYAVWIERLGDEQLRGYLDRLADLDIEHAPLWGVPFAIKDNIDLAGVATTAGCPGYAYTPSRSATVIERLVGAGAIPLGKTNMDQFATGLVGTRSPYGAVRNAVNPDYVSGGSSSGSAVAVKLGLAEFALGTDTAGSGRVPAAFNELVGFKPTRGWWSTYGVVPACRTLDRVSVFAQTIADVRAVARLAGGFDTRDPFSRRVEFRDFDAGAVRYGCFDPATMTDIDEAYRACYASFVDGLPGTPTLIDPAPFLEAAQLLYDGPWLAERFAAVGEFLHTNPDALHPVTREVIAQGMSASAVDYFRAEYRLAALKREAEAAFAGFDRVATARTSPAYRLYALPDGVRPALVRCDGGASVEVEVWSLPAREIGGFLAGVAPPLALGSVELDDGTWISGFVAEGAATVDAQDTTRFGGWRPYRRAASAMR